MIQGWAAGGRLNPPLGLFGLALSLKCANHSTEHA